MDQLRKTDLFIIDDSQLKILIEDIRKSTFMNGALYMRRECFQLADSSGQQTAIASIDLEKLYKTFSIEIDKS